MSSEAAPQVSIIVLNYNGERYLARCLECLQGQTFSNFEVIILDNASSDSSAEVAKPFLEDNRFQFIRSEKNLGVAGGRNLAAQHARGDYIAFIDNDGYAEPKWLEHCLQTIQADPGIGATSSLVFFESRPGILNGAGGSMNLQGFAGDLCFGIEENAAVFSNEVLYPMGCGTIIRSSLWRTIAPLDEAVLKWFDDTEIGIRVWKSGYSVVLAREARVHHDFHSSDAIITPKNWQRALLFEKARVRQMLKYLPVKSFLPWLWKEITLAIRNTLGGKPSYPILMALVWLWNIAHLPSVFSIRLRFRNSQTIPSRLLVPTWGEFDAQEAAQHVSNQ